MDWLTEPFALGFQQRALLGGALAAAALALVGAWVVIRGMSFLGDALVHGVVPGAALAALLDVNPALGALAAALVMMLGVHLVHRQNVFSEDTSIGLLFVGMLGLGVILLSRAPSSSGTLTGILFGDALGVSEADAALAGGVAAAALLASVVMHRSFLALTFSPRKAQTLGLRPRLAHAVMLALITLTIVGSYRTVGALLVLGLLIGPPAAAALLVRRVPSMMALAVLLGVLSVFVGLLVSYHADTSGSATMAVTPIVLFFLVLGARAAVDRARRRSMRPPAPPA